ADRSQGGEIGQHEIEIAGRRTLTALDEWAAAIGTGTLEFDKVRPLACLQLFNGSSALGLVAIATAPAAARAVSGIVGTEDALGIVFKEGDPELAAILAVVLDQFVVTAPTDLAVDQEFFEKDEMIQPAGSAVGVLGWQADRDLGGDGERTPWASFGIVG